MANDLTTDTSQDNPIASYYNWLFQKLGYRPQVPRDAITDLTVGPRTPVPFGRQSASSNVTAPTRNGPPSVYQGDENRYKGPQTPGILDRIKTGAQGAWDYLDAAQAGLDSAFGITPIHLPGANYTVRKGPPSVYEADAARYKGPQPKGGRMPDVNPMGDALGTNYDTPEVDTGRIRSAAGTPLAAYEPKAKAAAPKDPNAGMHKVWYKDTGRGIQRVGVGDTAPAGVDPESYDWESNKMTGAQRLLRGAYDVNEEGAPKAHGGSIDHASRIAGEKSTPCHTGIIHMAVGGRTDHLPMNVLEGSYVLPADIVSGLGEGNTLAGGKILDNMFSGKMGPAGAAIPSFKATPKYPELQKVMPEDYDKYINAAQKAGRAMAGSQQASVAPASAGAARGGTIASRNKRPVPIVAAGGEYVIHPEDVARFGGGDINKGHEKLDHFVKFVRANTVKTLRKLPGPRKD